MSRAIELAKKGLFSTDPNPRVGCVIAIGEEIIAEGWHEKAGQKHAEIMALENANQPVKGATCYVTLEPCSHHGRTSPCSDALIKAGIGRLVVAMEDPNPRVSGNGFAALRKAGVQVETGVMEQESRELNPGFIKRMQTGLPLVTCKFAMSLDGRTAMASGESQWITSKQSRQDIQILRARSSAIVTGSSTVTIDDPSMNARSEDFPESLDPKQNIMQPWRVIMDSKLSVKPSAKIFKLPGKVIWATTENVNSSDDTEQLTMLQLQADDKGKVRPDLLIQWLADQGCNEVMIEAGAELSGAFIAADLVDRLVVYIAPKVLGDNARGLLHLPGLEKLAQAKQYRFVDARICGPDVCLTYVRE
ncbi:MAG: bifunctional diaminohydroxyphosphoribosylaminopyrimidine deaminase/5-amino-6-(5-phosphoribosylamino)uracil reductase RibD [Gammaproteobacteria bacterium]|nr:MAG: bifunctional diaminohydroxyphosphoribosylaminopyrimidine deaminase/5-amino-6-(5-phosphoribosylamino)uracil reductase RibD [Gammaproteobacteria bacterium]